MFPEYGVTLYHGIAMPRDQIEAGKHHNTRWEA